MFVKARLDGYLGDIVELFDQLKTKMAKVANCYAQLAAGYDYAARFNDLDTVRSRDERKDRISSVYKYLSTMFSEWSGNYKANSQSFEMILNSSNKHSLILITSLNDVIN